jgi:glycosyltransferase involved in cell wall biosynthesis
LRIAHFVQRYPPALGGSEAYFARLSRFLVEEGHQVTVFTTTALDLEAFWKTSGRCAPSGVSLQDGVTVHRYSLWRAPEQRHILRVLSQIPIRPWQRLTLSCNPIAWGMWRDAGRVDTAFDLVHAGAFPYGWPLACGLRLARRLRVPFLLTPFLHTGDPEDPRDRTRRAYTSPALLSLARAAERIFVQTEGEKNVLVQHGIPETRLISQGMGVDLATCTGGARERVRAEWRVRPEEVIIGHLGNLSVEKGSVDLLRAARRAWRRGCHFHVVLAGPDMPNFRRCWDHFADAGPVHRLGVLTDQQKCDFFAGIDAFALPSRSDSFGLVLLEAWANGAATVGYRAGGVADVIRHEQDGLLVRCGDTQGLAEALTRLTSDAELRKRLGSAGRARLPVAFRWEDKLRLARRVYEQVSQRKGPPVPTGGPI